MMESVEGVPTAKAIDLLRWMILSRTLEDRLHKLYKQSHLRGRLISGRGQEAIPIGAASALTADDIVAPVHRDLGVHLVRGTNPATVLLHYLGRASGPSRGRDGDIHFGEWDRGVFPMVSHLPDSWPVIAGVGLSFALRGESRVGMAFCGDGATSTGVWHETLNFCSVFQLPTVFVVENNQYAYSTPISRQFRVERLSDRSQSYAIPGVTVDGNDVLEVYSTVAEAVERARARKGPTLIEAVTMRLDGHAIHDNASYVPQELIQRWKRRDPIERLRSRLLESGVEPQQLEPLWEDASRQVNQALSYATSAPVPEGSQLMESLYACSAK